MRGSFEDGQLLNVQYNADPAGYLSAVQNSGAGGAALLQKATASVTGTTAPSVALKVGLISSSSSTLSQMGLSSDVFYLASHVMYGSRRLGVKEYYPAQYRYEQNVAKTPAQNKASLDSSTTSYRMPWYSYLYNSMIAYDKTSPFSNGNVYPFWSTHIVGQKRYELSNHLGNVMAVVSDKITEQGTNKRAALRAAYDYYPFGMQMPMRVVEDGSVHCVPVNQIVEGRVAIRPFIG